MLHFSKWHGLGNDFIIMEARPENFGKRGAAELAQKLCHRNFGVGGDGLVFVYQEQGMVNMRIFNADGSEPEMCGNGIRCAARFAYQRGLAHGSCFPINTRAGIRLPELVFDGDRITAVRVDMGEPVLSGEEIPVAGFGRNRVIAAKLEVEGITLEYTAVSMGNPHCVLFVEDVDQAPVSSLGPRVEHHQSFPRQTNVEFAEVISPREINLRVWERGVGETMACGTGTCAAVVAGVLNGKLEKQVKVNLPGGRLEIEWGNDNHVYMTGPAVHVFDGELSAEF